MVADVRCGCRGPPPRGPPGHGHGSRRIASDRDPSRAAAGGPPGPRPAPGRHRRSSSPGSSSSSTRAAAAAAAITATAAAGGAVTVAAARRGRRSLRLPGTAARPGGAGLKFRPLPLAKKYALELDLKTRCAKKNAKIRKKAKNMVEAFLCQCNAGSSLTRTDTRHSCRRAFTD